MAGTVQALLVREASGVERVLPLGPDPVTIGRDATCTIRVESPYVSRQHARIEAQDGVPTLVDLGSRNGSLLNGARVERSAPLNAGAVIGLGDATIECLGESATAEITRVYAPQPAPDEVPPADALYVDPQVYEVHVGGRPLERRLSAQEFQLLSYLYQHRDRVCTRKELGDAIWGADLWDPNMLHRLVHRLKEKLEPQPDQPRYIQTVPWVGYRCTP